MKNLFEKWFCKHKWKSHSKDRIQDGYFEWEKSSYDREVLICTNCGKIKIIEY